MKKTIDIHLGGLLFHLDEDAYDRIFAYLEAVKQRLKNEEGYDEMLRDIESRLAELFFASLHPGKQVISIHEVTSAMETLGRPEDFSENSHQNEP
ncbi:MAG TPA: PspC family transcriptional regulator, partial [Cryomorphaceae bacterium]|nr:PspC family transcriptional regulator [Cryomorphaceae bacterium]